MQTPFAETVPTTTFTPMPLRARGVLETLDLTIKVFRRYAGVLLAWAALIVGACGAVGMFGAFSAGVSALNPSYGGGMGESQIASIMLSSLGSMVLLVFCFPLLVGASSCCVAGAVRGQRIRFAQCWSFTRPRYWSMLGQTILATIMLWIALIGVFIVVGIVAALSIAVVSQLPGAVAIPLGIVAAICFYAGFFVASLLAGLWVVLVPVVVCMEENNRSSSALTRASSLLRGNWRRAAGLMLLVWLGFAVMASVTQAPFFIAMSGGRPGSGMLVASSAVYMLLWMCAVPFYTLLITLFYLDARVRNEALDLEWTSHTGTPQVAQQMSATPANFYPPVERAASPAVENNLTRPNASVWSAPAEDLATMPLSAFTPQTAPSEPISPVTPNAQNNRTQPLQTQPLNEYASASDTSSTRYDATGSANASSPTPFESAPSWKPPTPPAQTSTSDFFAPATSPNSTIEAAPSGDFSAPPATSSTRFVDDSEPLAESDKCLQCGNEVSSTQSFCMNCGARLSRGGDFSTGFGL